MKKFFIFLVSVFLLLAAAAAVFVATFDVNKYKNQITDALEKTLGKPVEIGRVGLKWQDGIAFEISKLAVYPDSAKQLAPGIQLDSASAALELSPLLHKKIQISTIILDKPTVDIVRVADGNILVGGIDFKEKPSSAAASPQAASSPGSSAPAFSIDSFKIRGAHILFHDKSAAPPSTIEVTDLDLTVSNFSLTEAFTFDGAASIFSGKQNIKISGKIRLPQGASPGALDGFTAETDLGDLDMEKLFAAFPKLASLGIKEKPAGIFSVKTDHLDLNPQAVGTVKAQVTFQKGRLVLAGINSAVEQIDFMGFVDGNRIGIDHLNANVMGGSVALSGTVTDFKANPVLVFKGQAANLLLAPVVKSANASAPSLEGHVSLSMEGQAKGLLWENIAKTLNGRARITMNDGVLLNYNLLKDVIDKISLIPGASDALKNNLPQIYSQREQDKSTVLKPVDLSANIVNGVFFLDPLDLATDYLQIHGAGEIGLDRHTNIRANLIMNADISKALAAAFNSVQLLFNDSGQIVLPLVVEGNLPQVKIVPDKQYITSKLLSAATQQAVQGIVSDPKNSLNTLQDIFKKNIKGLKI